MTDGDFYKSCRPMVSKMCLLFLSDVAMERRHSMIYAPRTPAQLVRICQENSAPGIDLKLHHENFMRIPKRGIRPVQPQGSLAVWLFYMWFIR